MIRFKKIFPHNFSFFFLKMFNLFFNLKNHEKKKKFKKFSKFSLRIAMVSVEKRRRKTVCVDRGLCHRTQNWAKNFRRRPSSFLDSLNN